MNPSSAKTLSKYGLSAMDWVEIWRKQEGKCAVCRKVPNGRLCIDHDHVRDYKKLPPEKRKLRIRGLLCWFCNEHYVGRAITIQKSRNVTEYLEAYQDRLVQYGMSA